MTTIYLWAIGVLLAISALTQLVIAARGEGRHKSAMEYLLDGITAAIFAGFAFALVVA